MAFLIVGIVLAVIVALLITLQVRASNSSVDGLYSKAKQQWINFFGDSTQNSDDSNGDNGASTHLECINEICVEKEGKGTDSSSCSTVGESCTLGALTAAFTVSPNNPTTQDTPQFNAENSQGDITLYEWDFGDGSDKKAVTNKKINHAYNVPGIFTVKLVVHDDVGNLDEIALKVTISAVSNNEVPPLAAFTVSAEYPGPGQPVQFTDGSSDSNGVIDIETRTWDFGDGQTSLLTDPEHTYYELGEKEVSLTVVDRAGEQNVAQKILMVKEYPIADFRIIPNPDTNELRVGDSITFNGENSQDPTEPTKAISKWEWNISARSSYSGSIDDVILQGSYVSHVFTEEGTYSIALTVTSADGNRTNTLIKEIEILPKLIIEPSVTHIYRYVEGTIDKSTKIRIKIKNEDETALNIYASIKIMDDTECDSDSPSIIMPSSLLIQPGDTTDFLDFKNLCYWPLNKETHIQITTGQEGSSTMWYTCVTCKANTAQCGPIIPGRC